MLLCISNSFFVLIFHAQACTLVKTFNKLKCFVWPVYWCECRFFCGRSTLCKHRHVLCFSNVIEGSCSWLSCGSILYRAVVGHPWKCIWPSVFCHMPQITYRSVKVYLHQILYRSVALDLCTEAFWGTIFPDTDSRAFARTLPFCVTPNGAALSIGFSSAAMGHITEDM